MFRVILITLLLSGILYAQPQQSEHFRIAKSVLDAGGTQSASTNFRLVSAFGQPTPIGFQSSASFLLSAGFLSPSFGVAVLSPIQQLVIKQARPDVILYWESIADAHSYVIYRATDPLFTPSESNRIGTAMDTTFTDLGALDLAPVQHYYLVTSSTESEPNFRGNPSPAAKSASPHKEQRKHVIAR